MLRGAGISLPIAGCRLAGAHHALGQQLIIGIPSATRFTNQLTPLTVVAMGMLAAGLWDMDAGATSVVSRYRASADYMAAGRATCAMLVALSLWPLVPLFRYYEDMPSPGAKPVRRSWLLATSLVRQWRGATV